MSTSFRFHRRFAAENLRWTNVVRARAARAVSLDKHSARAPLTALPPRCGDRYAEFLNAMLAGGAALAETGREVARVATRGPVKAALPILGLDLRRVGDMSV